MPVEEKWEGSQGGWEGHLTGRQIWPCKERGKEERREGSEEGRSIGFGCPSLSHSRALNLCVIVACHWPRGQGQWLASLGMTPLCSLSGSPGGVFLTWPVPPRMEPPPYGQVRKKETGAFCSWPVISGTESALWIGAGGRREHRPLGWTARNRVCAPQVWRGGAQLAAGPSPGESRGPLCSGPQPHELELLSQSDRARVTAQWCRLTWLLPRFSRFSWVTVSPFAVCSWDSFQRLQTLVSNCLDIMPFSLEIRCSELPHAVILEVLLTPEQLFT